MLDILDLWRWHILGMLFRANRCLPGFAWCLLMFDGRKLPSAWVALCEVVAKWTSWRVSGVWIVLVDLIPACAANFGLAILFIAASSDI